MIAYLAADLIWSTRLRSWIEAAGFTPRPARSGEALRALAGSGRLEALVCEADAEHALDVIAAAGELNASRPDDPVLVIAFGPHVEAELLHRARELGAHHVLARGAVESRLPAILGGLAGRPA